MKASLTRSTVKGSALLTVILLITVMAVLSVSMLRYSGTELRGNERNRLTLRAKNVAENISIYAAEQLTGKLFTLGTAPVGYFPYSGTSTSRIYMPPSSLLLSEFNTSVSGMDMRCAIESVTAYVQVTDTTSPNYGLQVATAKVPIIAKGTATRADIGTMRAYVEQDMELALVPLFQFGIFYNMDLEFFPGQDMTIAGPVHTNGRLMARGEQGGSADVTFTDRVTAAKGLYADGQMLATYVKRPGSTASGAGGTGAVNFTSITNVQSNLYRSSVWRDHLYGSATETDSTRNQFKTNANTYWGGNVRTNAHGTDLTLKLPGIGSYNAVDDPSTAIDERDSGRQIIEPRNPKKWNGASWVATTDTAASRDLKLARKCGLYIIVNPDDEARTGKLPDGTDQPMLPRSYRCWLNRINSDGTHTLREILLPGQPSFGYYDGGTAGLTTALIADDVMFKNLTPNRYTSYTIVGHNQVLRIPRSSRAWDDADTTSSATLTSAAYPINPGVSAPSTGYTGYLTTGGTGDDFPAEASATPYPAEAYFFDLRRANGNQGYISNIAGGGARSATNYVPRAIAKIDFDLARFKMAVNRTYSYVTASTGYRVDAPAAANWANSIYKSNGTPASLDLGMPTTAAGSTFTTFPDGSHTSYLDPYRMYFAPPIDAGTHLPVYPSDLRTLAVTATELNEAWYDGVAIYIHSVDAEQRLQSVTAGKDDRIDSGVRLINGRGPLISLTAAGRTGFTFVTNDAAYIIGHFNADGTVNATTSATGFGGFSARYPDSNGEKLAAVMADAITLLSQPVYSSSSSPYYQTNGWNDALSAFRVTDASWSSSWRSSAPSGSNNYEGLGTSATAIRPGALPTNSTPGAGGSTWRTKLPVVDTEFSVALLMGMVPSNHNAVGLTDRPPRSAANAQYSGGAHNFPRLLEDWHNDMGSGSTSGLYIRGSMVGLFESRVAMEPWNIRCYAAPERYWGLHENLRTAGHDLPLEPIVLSATRIGFRELTPGEFSTRQTSIEAMTAIP